MYLVVGAQGGGEAERPGERFRPLQVGLLELKPGQVADLDHRILGPSRMFAAQRALLAVQILVDVEVLEHEISKG